MQESLWKGQARKDQRRLLKLREMDLFFQPTSRATGRRAVGIAGGSSRGVVGGEGGSSRGERQAAGTENTGMAGSTANHLFDRRIPARQRGRRSEGESEEAAGRRREG